MSTDRYFVATGLDDEQRRRMADDLGGEGCVILIDRPRCIVAAAKTAPVIMLGDEGLIIGALYTAGRHERVSELSKDLSASIVAGRGELLVKAYWGSYVAILRGPDAEEVAILRAPLSGLPCLYRTTYNGSFAASDVALLERFGGLRRAIDWDALTRFAISPDLRFEETCLAGVREVRGGDRVELVGRASKATTLWSPWMFAARERQFDDRTEAARRLRDTVNAAMSTFASNSERAIVLLSGGLDSSVVTASAAASNYPVRAVTVCTNVPSGDEREFARATAEHVRVGLAVRHFDLDGIDLGRSAAAELPRPVARAFEFEGRRQAWLEAQSFGADTVLSGGGGDNIFCLQQSIAPVTDALESFDDRREFWRVARELSKLTGATLFTIARRAWFRSRQRGRQPPMPTDLRFLTPGLAHSTELLSHPWLVRPATVLQGKGAHVAGLVGVQGLTEDSGPLEQLPLQFPLLAQPVVELCLRIPSYFWFDNGCNRAIARHAFASLLPPEIAWRRSKGTPDGFVIDIYDTCRQQIRSMLLDGVLAARGLLDLPALAAVLDDPRPVRGTDHGRIMRLVDIEAWARSIQS